MRVLFVGDIFGSCGRRILAEHLAGLIREQAVDVCVANGENAAGGRGITENIARKLRKFGVQIITGGNHSLFDTEVYAARPPVCHLLRPLNLAHESRGFGKTVYTLADGRKIGVICLQGRTFMDESLLCPFAVGAAAAEELAAQTPVIIVDFHAEATSEKICLATYLDGRVSAVLGTHTHVQTADERILPRGTAFISDAGMTGPEASAIGMKLDAVLQKYLYQAQARFEPSNDGPMLNAVVLDIDDASGKARSITRIYTRVDFK